MELNSHARLTPLAIARRLVGIAGAAAVLVMLWLPPVSIAAPLASQHKLFARAASITQAANGFGDGSIHSQVSAYTGPVAYSPSSGSLDAQGNLKAIVSNTTGIPTLVSKDYGFGTQTQSQILAAATPYVLGQVMTLKTSLAAYLRANNLDRAYFTYDQEVRPLSTDHSWRLVWSITVDAAGVATYNDPSVIDARPQLLYMVYTPYSVMSGLPNDWAYPNAGVLQYQLRQPDGTPITNWTALQTGGAFDELQAQGVPLDPDRGVKCIVDKASVAGCSQAFPDARGLANSLSASSVILDYIRMVQPVYNSVEAPPGSGQFTQVASMSQSVDVRTYTHGYCPTVFDNQGRYGYTLKAQTDRYYIKPNGVYSLLASYMGTSLSPTKSYSLSTSNVTSEQAANISPWLIDAINPGGSLITASAVPNLVYLAPVNEVVCPPPPPPKQQCLLSVVSDGWANPWFEGVQLWEYPNGGQRASGTMLRQAMHYSHNNDHFIVDYWRTGTGNEWTDDPNASTYIDQRNAWNVSGIPACADSPMEICASIYCNNPGNNH